MSNAITIVICKSRGSDPAQKTLDQNLVDALADRPGVRVLVTPHLYDLAPDGPAVCRLRSISGDLIVLARLYPRAAYWTLDANQVKGHPARSPSSGEEDSVPVLEPAPLAPLAGRGAGGEGAWDRSLDAPSADAAKEAGSMPDRTIWCLDLRSYNEAKALLEQIEHILEQSTGQPLAAAERHEHPPADGETRVEEATEFRWYPVVDYSRCQNCLECLNFCLFGVFGVDESGRLIAEQPDACRNGCPACSRVCPSRAIMFPHHNSPAIAGDPHAPADGLDVGLTQLFGGTAPSNLAAAERNQALAEKPKADNTAKPVDKDNLDKDNLDHLVEELDKLDL